MNLRNEQLLQEAQRLRKQAYEDTIRIKCLLWLSVSGWTLFVITGLLVPA